MSKRRNSMDLSVEDSTPRKIKRSGSDSNIENKIDDPFVEISHHQGTLKKFFTSYFVTEFIVKNAISFPEEKLKQIFEKLIDKAYKNTNKLGKQVKINCLVNLHKLG